MEKLELILDFGKCMASIVTVTCFVLKRIRGRRIYNPYALFEALKVRDFGSNRSTITVIINKSARILWNQMELNFFHRYRIENGIEVLHVNKARLSFHGIKRTCSHCGF